MRVTLTDNTKRVILINGPIGSGKDYIGSYMKSINNFNTGAFKEELYKEVAKHYKTSYEEVLFLSTNRVTKELPMKLFGDKSPRQALIHVSEDLIKPKFGKDYFGKKFCESLRDGITICTDSGFRGEALAVVNYLGSENVIHIQLYREGCAFSGNDSRSYFELIDAGIYPVPYHNDRSVCYAGDFIMHQIVQKGWIKDYQDYILYVQNFDLGD